MKKYSFFLFAVATILSSCSKYGSVQLKYPIAPEAFIPENIHTIAILNRSKAKDGKDNHNITEAILSGEIAGSDKKASDECIRGVYDGMSGYQRLKLIIPSTKLYGTGNRVKPELLSWDVVQKICDSTKADALLVLETFDSNSDLLLGAVTNQIGSVLSGGTIAAPVPAQVRMNVLSFWRLYDPSTQKVIDESEATHYLTFGGAGQLPIPQPEQLRQTAYAAGEDYSVRFLPSYYYVRRDMYKRAKGSEKYKFLAAFRKSEVADWEGAMQSWLPLTKSNNYRNAGRACLNMAVACEVLGRSDEALTWAKKSYEDYGNKVARTYTNILLDRRRYE